MISRILTASFRLILMVLAVESGLSIWHVPSVAGQTYSQLDIDPKYALQYLEPKPNQSDLGQFEELSEAEKKAILAHNKPIRIKIADDKKKVETILTSNGDVNNAVFKEFFDGHVFPEMTRLGESNINLSNLGTLCADFLKSYLSSKITGQARIRFIDSICVPSLVSIYSNKDLHPAARLSAVYLLGSLDNAVSSKSPPAPPSPSQNALNELLKIIDAADSQPFLMVGALVGIQRQFEIDAASTNKLADAERNRIKTIATQILTDAFAGQDKWNRDMSYWMKRRAAQMIGVSKDAKSLDLLVAAMEQKDNPLSLRIDAMEAIGNLGLAKAEEGTIKSIARFLSESYQTEASWLAGQVESLKYDNMLFEDLDLEVTGTDWTAKSPAAAAGRGGPAAGRGGRGSGGDLGGAVGGIGEGGMAGGMEGGMAGGMEGGMAGGMEGGMAGGMEGGMAGGMEGGMGDGIEGGRGGGAPMAGGGRGRPGGGSQVGTPAPKKNKFVELPNFQLQVARTRIKTLASIGVKVLKPEPNKGLHNAASSEVKKLIDSIVSNLETIRKESNVGIENLDPRAQKRKGNLLDEEEKEKEEEKSITEQLTNHCSTTSVKLLEAIGEKPEEAKKEEVKEEKAAKEEKGE